MSTLLETLRLQLARFDDDAFAALANKGLLRRARKDLEKEKAEIIDATPSLVVVRFAGHRIEFDARGPSQATCSCPAKKGCQHLLAAALAVAALPAEVPGRVAASPGLLEAEDPLEPLRKSLLAMTAGDLRRHAGKAGYRWAWQFVQDLDLENDVVLSGERNITIAFRHPPVVLRYMGGDIAALLPDANVRQSEKYQVAAVLAFHRAHGRQLERPEERVEKSAALDLGKDHALAADRSSDLLDSRLRLMAAVRQLAEECVSLGLAHLSPGIHERFETLAVWAHGAQCYRLALLLRRISDHVEMLLVRAGGADEQRLFDELAFANALVSALARAAARGEAPAALIGRARNEYEEVGPLELLGLGAHPWRSASGYLGLTMLFWSPVHKSFYSCTDARPELQRGFDPVARYKASGPWSGLGAPAMATGRRLVLTGALTSAAGRISASEKTTATVLAPDPGGFVSSFRSYSNWNEVAHERASRRRSLLAEAEPLKDWVILRPTSFRRAHFDSARQTMSWGLVDDQDKVMLAELSYDPYSAAAIERLAELDAKEGLLVVARLRGGSGHSIAEPLSLIRPSEGTDSSPVDALYFDAPTEAGVFGRALSRLRRRPATAGGGITGAVLGVSPLHSEGRNWLRLLAERGLAANGQTGVREEFTGWLARLTAAGFSVFPQCVTGETSACVLRAQYLFLQYEHLLDDSSEQMA